MFCLLQHLSALLSVLEAAPGAEERSAPALRREAQGRGQQPVALVLPPPHLLEAGSAGRARRSLPVSTDRDKMDFPGLVGDCPPRAVKASPSGEAGGEGAQPPAAAWLSGRPCHGPVTPRAAGLSSSLEAAPSGLPGVTANRNRRDSTSLQLPETV